MILSDCHMHSHHSSDSSASMESMIDAALKKNLKTICFTEHLDYDYPLTKDSPKDNFLLDIPAYQSEFKELRDKYSGKIELLFGIELGLMPYLQPRYQDITASNSFDFIIGSSHLVDGADPYYPEYFAGQTPRQAYQKYFESILKNLQCYDNFCSYGHLDYVVRYGPGGYDAYNYSDFRELFDEILKTLIVKNKAFEINTAGFKYSLSHPHPHFEIIKRYRELGGELMTIGSDAHAPEQIAYNFNKISDFLTGLSYKYYTVYKKCEPVMCPL